MWHECKFERSINKKLKNIQNENNTPSENGSPSKNIQDSPNEHYGINFDDIQLEEEKKEKTEKKGKKVKSIGEMDFYEVFTFENLYR